MALTFNTFELDHMASALEAFREAQAETDLTNAQEANLLAMIKGEIARRERAASAQVIEPGARPVQYNVGGTIITRYETPAAAHGVKAPRKGPDGKGVKIDDLDALLMLVGDASDLVPEA